jgi:hypothetical protein
MLHTILFGFGGWIGLMGSVMYIWKCERPITETQMLIAAVAPLVLPYTLVFVSFALQCALFLIQNILTAMLHHELVIMCMASVLVGASAGAGYAYASHKITEFNMSETERIQAELAAATELEEEDYEADEESESPNPPWPTEEIEQVLEPAPKMLRIKTPTQSLTELSTPSSEVMPKAPIVRPQQEVVQAPVVTADLTTETPPAI